MLDGYRGVNYNVQPDKRDDSADKSRPFYCKKLSSVKEAVNTASGYLVNGATCTGMYLRFSNIDPR